EPGPEPFECQTPEPAGALALDLADDELEVAPPLVDGERPQGPDLHPFLRVRRQTLRVAAEHDAPELGRRVAQREVAVPGRVALPPRHLAGDPERRERALQELADKSVDRRDR